MPKYMPRGTTRKSTTQNTYDRALESQQEDYVRLMRREAEKLIGDFKEQLERSMREEIANQMKQATQQLGGSAGASLDSSSFAPTASGIASFIGQAINIYLARPKYSQSSAESERSRQSLSQFRASRAESLAELTGTLSLGERNS